ncbi:MAG: energy transducer TonB [Opitutales bacterium]
MPSSFRSSDSKSFPTMGVVTGIIVCGLIFLAIPLTQMFTDYSRANEEILAIELAPPPPPPPIEEPPPPPEEEPPPPDFEPPPPPISLEQLEIALEAGTGESMAGDFAMPNLTIKKEELGGLEIFDISDLDKKPTTVKQVAPLFPVEARRRGLSGYAVAQFIIDQRGGVRDVIIISSSDSVFNKPTIEAIRQWKFTPGEKGGRIVTTRAEARMPYQIQ